MSVVPEPSMSASRTRRWSNCSGWSNQRRVVHRDLGAEAAVAEIRPVADLAVADAHQVGQAVAGHVGQIDRLRPSANTRRGPVLVQRVGETLALRRIRPPPAMGAR